MPLEFWNIDLPALLVGILASALCALLGSFLVLRKQAMMGDTLSHVILPGLAIAFAVSGTIYGPYMMLGALAACIISVLLIKFLQGFGLIESGAAMGIVFTSMFALGIILLETQVGSKVHLDAQHALYGSLELTYWPTPLSLETMPQQIKTLGILFIVALLMVRVFFKELLAVSFDPLFASAQGIHSGIISTALMLLTAMAAVACFEAVGSILVIALFICPAATARMMTDDLKTQLRLSAAYGAVSAIAGYILAVIIPAFFGYEHSLSAGGMIAVTAGAIQITAMLFAPRYGYAPSRGTSKT